MIPVKVLLLLSSILPSQSEIHSLYYMHTALVSKYEYVYFYNSNVELDDIQMSLCNRVNKADFMTRLCEESKRLFNEMDDLQYKQRWILSTYMFTLMELKRNEYSTWWDWWHTDLHVFQWRHGCAVERHSNGSVMFLQGSDEYAYDGEIMTLPYLSLHWMPLVLYTIFPNYHIIWHRESVSSLERKCVETLTRFTDLQREGKFIMESRPRVHTVVKESGSSGKSLLVCLATGFYPKHVQMEIRLNQTLVREDQLNSEGIRPNADGSFQLKKSLEILSSERSQYQCVVTHQTLPDPLFIRWEEPPRERGPSSDVIEASSSLGSMDAVTGVSSCFFVVFLIFLTFNLLRNYGKQNTLKKTPSLVQLSALQKTQMNPELLEEIRPEICAAALHTDSDEENPTDPSIEEVHTEEVHDTQSLCETEATPAARGAMMGSYNNILPDFAMEREDQNTITQNALLLPLPRRCRSKDTLSLPNLAMEREDQNTITQNALLLPPPRRCRSKDISSLPNFV